jgi:hypothetical protein
MFSEGTFKHVANRRKIAARLKAAPLTLRRKLFGVLFASIAFIIYICTIFILPQVQNSLYCCEQSSVAAAISNIKYGSPLGSLYSGVFDYLVQHYKTPLEQALKEANVADIGLPAAAPGELYATTRDGNGVGYPLVATIGFRLFGMHAWALTVVMLLLMFVSASAFLLRFPRHAPAIVVMYFCALTVMLFTKMVWDPLVFWQIPIGGIRYFSLVSVLPLIHILAELDSQETQLGARARLAWALLGLQTAILTIAILVRSSALSELAAIAIVGLALVWRNLREVSRLRELFTKLAAIIGAGLLIWGAIGVSMPSYVTEGRFGTSIWQRITESLGVSPAWPYPGVDAMFHCPNLPNGFLSGADDQNGICMWYDYANRHGIPALEIRTGTQGPLYETALREAFFRIAANNTQEVLRTFLYYKPLLIPSTLADSLRLNFNADQSKSINPGGPKVIPYQSTAVGLLLLSLLVMLATVIGAPIILEELPRWTARILILALSATPAYFAAWALPHTIADLILYCLMAVGLLLNGAMLGVKHLWRRGWVMTSNATSPQSDVERLTL